MSTESSILTILNNYLINNNLYNDIRDTINKNLDNNINNTNVNNIINNITNKDNINIINTSTSTPASTPDLISGKRYLHLYLKSGRAFIDYFTESDIDNKLICSIQFAKQSFRSKPVNFNVEPIFNESFYIDLQPKGVGIIPLESLIDLNEPLHICIIKTNLSGKENLFTSLLGTRYIDWRRVLVTGKLSLSLEIISNDSRNSIGVLDFDLELLPKPTKSISKIPTDSIEYVSQQLIINQINNEKLILTESEQKFRSFAKLWWRDYLQIRNEHSSRSITMFAQSEDGYTRFVCSYVTPINASRLLDSSLHAARFVRLIPFEKNMKIGGERTGIWNSTHTFLSMRRGDIENHVLLLCSLLLGFGLDAYVCIGSNSKGQHMWVLTRDSSNNVCLWEALTGRKTDISSCKSIELETLKQTYTSIGCIFNHNTFYANVQFNDAVIGCDWALENELSWKVIGSDVISTLIPISPPNLLPSTLNPLQEEIRIESELRRLFSHRRKESINSDMIIDDDLSDILGPSLASYESERLCGYAFGNEEFQQSVQNKIPLFYIFKAFPIQFNIRDSDKMYLTMIENVSCLDILLIRGDNVRFGLRVKCYIYPEDIICCWVSLGVKCKPSN